MSVKKDIAIAVASGVGTAIAMRGLGHLFEHISKKRSRKHTEEEVKARRGDDYSKGRQR